MTTSPVDRMITSPVDQMITYRVDQMKLFGGQEKRLDEVETPID